MTEYLKQAPLSSEQVTEEVRRAVSEMLSRIERERVERIRRYSRELDAWAPESFGIDDATIAKAADELRLDEPVVIVAGAQAGAAR